MTSKTSKRQTPGHGARGRDRARVRPLRRRRPACTASPTTASASGPPPAPGWSPSIPRAASPRARSTCACDAGTAFDGTYLYQIAEARIDKIDPATGEVVASIPAPGHGGDSGLTWAEGSLWVGQYRDRKIHQIDPETGAVMRTIESNRFVTGVTWVDGELWHGTWEGDESEIRRIDPESGAVLERLEMPHGTGVSGLESDGADLFYCGGGDERQGPRRAASERRQIVITAQGAHHEHSHCRSEHREPSRRVQGPMDRRAQDAAGARKGTDAPARPDRRASAARCRGCASRRTTSSTRPRAGARSPTCSKAAASCWCSTSCSARAGSRAARAARSWPTTPTA